MLLLCYFCHLGCVTYLFLLTTTTTTTVILWASVKALSHTSEMNTPQDEGSVSSSALTPSFSQHTVTTKQSIMCYLFEKVTFTVNLKVTCYFNYLKEVV